MLYDTELNERSCGLGALFPKMKLCRWKRRLKVDAKTVDSQSSAKATISIVEEIFQATARTQSKRIPSTFTPEYLFCTVVTPSAGEPLFDRTRQVAQHLASVRDNIQGRDGLRQALEHFCAASPDVPFVALDEELIGACARAKQIANWYKDVTSLILFIDVRQIDEASLVRCNVLRRRLGLKEEERYASTMLSWSELPLDAVRCRMPWSTIVQGAISTSWFPALNWTSVGEPSVELATQPERFTNLDIDVPKMFNYLEKAFGMAPLAKVTRDVVEVLLAWSLGHTRLLLLKKEETINARCDRTGDIDSWLKITDNGRRSLMCGELQEYVWGDEEPEPEGESDPSVERSAEMILQGRDFSPHSSIRIPEERRWSSELERGSGTIPDLPPASRLRRTLSGGDPALVSRELRSRSRSIVTDKRRRQLTRNHFSNEAIDERRVEYSITRSKRCDTIEIAKELATLARLKTIPDYPDDSPLFVQLEEAVKVPLPLDSAHKSFVDVTNTTKPDADKRPDSQIDEVEDEMVILQSDSATQASIQSKSAVRLDANVTTKIQEAGYNAVSWSPPFVLPEDRWPAFVERSSTGNQRPESQRTSAAEFMSTPLTENTIAIDDDELVDCPHSFKDERWGSRNDSATAVAESSIPNIIVWDTGGVRMILKPDEEPPPLDGDNSPLLELTPAKETTLADRTESRLPRWTPGKLKASTEEKASVAPSQSLAKRKSSMEGARSRLPKPAQPRKQTEPVVNRWPSD